MFIPSLRFFALFCVACALTACAPKPAPEPLKAAVAAGDALRPVDEGNAAGWLNEAGGHSWRGLPYAAPPVGALRWKPPQSFVPWQGTRDALQPGSPCIQYGWAMGGVGSDGSHEGSEDCLFLNIDAPRMDAAQAAAARLPVMVWIHGGANTVGHAAGYDGSRLAASQNVVVVSINYRLGPFGWFVLPRGASAGVPDPLEGSGNWGTLDTLEALRWVQSHIAAFGGDPANVTVFGQSAGGTNALALLVSPMSEGLLHRVIVQSLGFGLAQMPRVSHYADDPQPGGPWSSAEILLKALVQAGRASDRASARTLADTLSADEIATFLRGMDPWALYALYHPSNIETDLFPTVIQDGAVLRQGAVEELLADPARHLSVPTMLGVTRDEPKLFMAFDPRLVTTLAGAPIWIRDTDAYEREAHYRAELWRANGVDRPARALSAAGAALFAYRWDWRDEGRFFGVIDGSKLIGAAHGLEIPFVFGSFDSWPGKDVLFSEENRPARMVLSEAMMSYWAEFAAHGNPGRGRDGTLPQWPAWPAGAAEPDYMVFDIPDNGGIRTANEPASREQVVALMEQQEPDSPEACAMFSATFRNRVDAWADAAWQRYKSGYCAGQPGATRVLR